MFFYPRSLVTLHFRQMRRRIGATLACVKNQKPTALQLFHGAPVGLITEQPWSQIMEASSPGLPFVIGPRRRVENVFDSGPIERLMHGNGVGVEPCLGRAGAQPE